MQTVPFRECLRSFVDFLEDSKGSCDKIVLIGHNSASFDTHILLRTIQEYSPELLHTMTELNIHFADSLVLFRNLIKEGREGGYQIPVPCPNLAQIPLPRLIFAKIPVTKPKIPLLMIICKIMRLSLIHI